MKLPDEVRRRSESVNATPLVSTVKLAVKVMISVDKGIGDVLENDRRTKFSRCDWRKVIKTATSSGGVTIDFGLPATDSMIERYAAEKI